MSDATPVDLRRQATPKKLESPNVEAPHADASLPDEYDAATTRVGLVDRSDLGRLRVTGTDAIDLLNRLSTNRLNDLPVGHGAYTVVTTNKGRIIDLLFVLRLEDHLSVTTSPDAHQVIADWIEFYTFVEDVAVEDQTGKSATLGLMGPSAAALLDRVSKTDASAMGPYASAVTSIEGVEVLIVRTDFAGSPAFDLVLQSEEVDGLWKHLLDEGSDSGIMPVGEDALEVLRVVQGRPRYGNELTEEFNPLEANLIEHVSFNKECYIGQEVVARLNTYDKVQKRLVGLSWEGEYDPALTSELATGGKSVGTLTSAATSPRTPRRIGLGYVRNGQAEPGTELVMGSGDVETVVRVEELPLTP
jgi:folate-binding protein YgfZ